MTAHQSDIVTDVLIDLISSKAIDIRTLPTRYMNEKVCVALVSMKHLPGLRLLSLIPSEYRTVVVCHEAIITNPHNLQFVPKTVINAELIETALELDGNTLEYINEEDRTYRYCDIACRSKGTSLRWVPKNVITHYLCKAAVTQNGLAAQFFTQEYKTLELLEIAYRNTDPIFISVLLEYIPGDILKMIFQKLQTK